MYKKRKKRKEQTIMIVILSVLIFIMIIINFVIPNRNLSFAEKALKDSGLFIQKTVYAPIKFFKNIFNKENKFNNENYQKLLEDNKKLSSLEVINDEYKKQIEEMRNLLELNTVLSDKMHLNASVINRNLGFWDNLITIDKGSSSGLETNMAVVVPNGLIGLITKVSNFTSSVKLLTGFDNNQKLSVKIDIGDNYLYGLLVGYNKTNKTYMIEGISENLDIEIGSKVTTTGMGENIPAGILIGKVVGVTTDNFDLAKIVEVKSDINFNDISYVTVLKKGVNR